MNRFISILGMCAVILTMTLFLNSSVLGQERPDRRYSKEGGRQPCKEYSLTKKESGHNFEWTLEYQNAIASFNYPRNEDQRNSVPTLAIYACTDIDNDGLLEAVVEFYSAEGAHCCFEYSFYKKNGKKLVRYPIDGCCSFKFQDIDGEGIKEVITRDLRLQYFAGLPSAGSPTLPRIFCFRNDKFDNCTKEFPKVVEDEIQQTLKEKSRLAGDSLMRDVALKYLALHILIEKEEEGWQGIKEYYPATYGWLKENEADLKQRLSKQSQGRF